MLTDRANTICLLNILREYSDESHVMPMREIISMMKVVYDMDVDRRTVYGAVTLLKDLGYDISDYEENGKGYYLRTREFEPSEVRLLMDAVYSLQSIPVRQTEQLIKKLQGFLSIHERKPYRHLTVVRPEHKTPNRSVFLNIEVLDEAMSKKMKVEFTYLQYGMDKKLHPRPHGKYTVNPYRMVCENEHYYLICIMEGKPCLSYYRIDLIQDISITERTLDPLPPDVNPATQSVAYAFTGRPESILLRCEQHTLGNLIDKFGSGINIISHDETTYTARFTAPATGVLFWALQYLPYVEILEPEHLRQEICEAVHNSSY